MNLEISLKKSRLELLDTKTRIEIKWISHTHTHTYLDLSISLCVCVCVCVCERKGMELASEIGNTTRNL